MDKTFFGQQIDRLKRTYAQGAMNEERAQVLWDRFKAVPNQVFENAVNYLISEYTTQALPAISRFAEAVGMFRTNPNVVIGDLPTGFACNPCRDFGFGFIGETVVACTCGKGRCISPQELAVHQGHYDKGKRYLKRPGAAIGTSLPYDPNERIG